MLPPLNWRVWAILIAAEEGLRNCEYAVICHVVFYLKIYDISRYRSILSKLKKTRIVSCPTARPHAFQRPCRPMEFTCEFSVVYLPIDRCGVISLFFIHYFFARVCPLFSGAIFEINGMLKSKVTIFVWVAGRNGRACKKYWKTKCKPGFIFECSQDLKKLLSRRSEV